MARVILVAIAICLELRVEGQNSRKIQVSSSAISGGDVEVVGSLDLPFGTILTIEGQWEEPGSPAKREWFQVKSINGRRLGRDHFVEVVGAGRQPAEVACVYKGFQSGGWLGSPTGKTQAPFWRQ